MPPSSAAASAKKQADPQRIEGDDDDDDDNDNGERGGRVGGGGARPRQPPPVQAALPSPVRSAQHPSVSVEQAARPSFRIAVGDPHKVGDLTSSHIDSSVRTQGCYSGGGGLLRGWCVLTCDVGGIDHLQGVQAERV
jgi:sorting nexin-1/2